jgi:hypothetical protein
MVNIFLIYPYQRLLWITKYSILIMFCFKIGPITPGAAVEREGDAHV